jgi:FKBP-type peptidyl-prolyl cis-trans isomerase FklB
MTSARLATETNLTVSKMGLLRVLGLCAGLLAGSLPAIGLRAAETEPLQDEGAQASYSIGYRMAANIRREIGSDVDLTAFLAGVRDQLDGAPSRVSEEQANAALRALVATRQAAAAAAAEENVKRGEDFLAENGARDGVVTLPSGLQYEVLTPAEGPKPAATDQVTTHYRGTLLDGTVFDSSYDRGEPATFPVNGVIAGWTEALQLMSVGSKWRLFIPPALAYGARGTGPIPANATLVFDVELLQIN